MANGMQFYNEYRNKASRSTCTSYGPWKETGCLARMLGYPKYKRYTVVFNHQEGYWDKPVESVWGGKWEYSNVKTH